MKKINVAVIGTGAMGKSHVRIYSELENVELKAVCDMDKKTADALAQKYNTKAFYNYKEIDEPLDAVSICVPTKYHKEVASYFIKKRVNVLVEKPIASSIEEAKELIKEAKENNVKLMVGHVERFNPVVQEIKKRIQNNELGKIYEIKTLRFSPFPHRIIDVGVTIDLAVHDIDAMLYLNKSRIKRIYSETARRIHAKKEDLLNALIKFENGVKGNLQTNWLTPKKVREIIITGEKGMFKANYITQELFLYKNKFTEENFDYSNGRMSMIEGEMKKIEIKNKEPLKAELENFAESIIKNKKPLISGEEGLANIMIAQKMIESSENNEVIRL